MACRRCHRRKVRCSGGDGERNIACDPCRASSAQCIFPVREKNVLVSESYVRALEQAVRQSQITAASAGPSPEGPIAPINERPPRRERQRFVENTTADAFVSRLRSLGAQGPNQESTDIRIDQASSLETTEHKSLPVYEYFSLSSDKDAVNVTLKLPPYPYAIHLINQFEAYMGYEYHWYLRQTFRRRVESTYSEPQHESARDRTWLCKLLVVLALGETYNSKGAQWIDLSGPASAQVPQPTAPPPGVELFEQAMSIFKTPCEEVSVDHVEALNLIAFYSYSLDRRRSAYIYAGLSMRIASSLMLHIPNGHKALSARDAEHARRLWWTSYLVLVELDVCFSQLHAVTHNFAYFVRQFAVCLHN